MNWGGDEGNLIILSAGFSAKGSPRSEAGRSPPAVPGHWRAGVSGGHTLQKGAGFIDFLVSLLVCSLYYIITHNLLKRIVYRILPRSGES